MAGIFVAADPGAGIAGPFCHLEFVGTKLLNNFPGFLLIKKAEMIVAIIARMICGVIGRAGNTIKDLRLPIVDVIWHGSTAKDFVGRGATRLERNFDAMGGKGIEQQPALRQPLQPGCLQAEPQFACRKVCGLQFNFAQFGFGGEGTKVRRGVGVVHDFQARVWPGLRNALACITTVYDTGISVVQASAAKTSKPPEASRDCLDFIVRQSLRMPLLTGQQEIQLGRLIRAWQDWPGGPDAAPPMVKKRGQRALNKFVECNIRLAHHIAQRFKGRGVDLEDLVQAGVEGLIQAYRRFDPELGYKSSTYAVWYCQQQCQVMVASQGRSVKIPTTASEQIKRIYRTAEVLASQLGREPTDREIEVQAALKPGSVSRLKMLYHFTNCTSLDSNHGQDGSWSGSEKGGALGDLIPFIDAEPERREQRELKKILHTIIDESPALSPQQRFLIRCRYLDENPTPRHKLAKQLNMHREALRRAEIAALQILRNLLPPEIKDCLQ